MIRSGRLVVANYIAEEIRKLRIQMTVTELRSFLEFWNVFRRFVSNVARIASPMSRSLKKIQAKYLRTLQEEEFQDLDTVKEKFISPFGIFIS